VILLLEVMDKEPTVMGMWAFTGIIGVGGFFLSRSWPWTAPLVVALVALNAWGLTMELNDPFVGPAILEEAGTSYPMHAAVTSVIAAALPLLGAVWGIGGRRRPNDETGIR
jgi:hypothetical protein